MNYTHYQYYDKLKEYDVNYLLWLIDNTICKDNNVVHDYKYPVLYLINEYIKIDKELILEIEKDFRARYNFYAVPKSMYNSFHSLSKFKN